MQSSLLAVGMRPPRPHNTSAARHCRLGHFARLSATPVFVILSEQAPTPEYLPLEFVCFLADQLLGLMKPSTGLPECVH